jgi:hypothetical protein
MARRRRYARDNRGRFASAGATARGGRLKTASGKKRETQTMKTSGGGVAGTIRRGNKTPKASAKPASSIRSTNKLARPKPQNQRIATGGKFGAKNTIKPGPKSPRTKMNKAIDNVIAKGKDLKGAREKLQGLKNQADALKGKMNAQDKARAQKAFDKPSVTDKRSRDYRGRLTKEGRRQDPSTGGKKKRKPRKK